MYGPRPRSRTCDCSGPQHRRDAHAHRTGSSSLKEYIPLHTCRVSGQWLAGRLHKAGGRSGPHIPTVECMGPRHPSTHSPLVLDGHGSTADGAQSQWYPRPPHTAHTYRGPHIPGTVCAPPQSRRRLLFVWAQAGSNLKVFWSPRSVLRIPKIPGTRGTLEPGPGPAGYRQSAPGVAI